VAEQDWVRLTQSQFEPIHIGKNIWVVPSWHDAPDPNGLVLELDPGLAFGTGSHSTTRLCMEWLEEHAPRGLSVLDYGCGSGILAMVAQKLGASRVCGVDIDPQAIESARYNSERNRCAIDYTLPEEFSRSAQPQTFDVVVANILSSPLKLMAPMLSSRVAPGGTDSGAGTTLLACSISSGGSRFSMPLKICLQAPQRTSPARSFSWSCATRNVVWQCGHWVASAIAVTGYRRSGRTSRPSHHVRPIPPSG
jgi:ribosomal protein L11 methylase PrmA